MTSSIRLPDRRSFRQMAAHQFRYDLRSFLRNRQSQFFTLALPVLLLVIFASVFGGHGDTVKIAGGRIDSSVSYVPAIMALGIIAAAFINLVISVTAQRETGVLKRRRVTPVSPSALIAGRSLTAVVTALGIAALLFRDRLDRLRCAHPGAYGSGPRPYRCRRRRLLLLPRRRTRLGHP